MFGRVQRLDHRLELQHLLAPLAAGGVGVVRGEEADRVVAPVVRQAAVDERRVLDELVHRHELDRGDAEVAEVLDHRRVGDGGVGAADLLGDLRVHHRQPLDVRLVDDALVVLVTRRAVVAPVEERVDDDRVHRVAQAVVEVDLLRRRGLGVTEGVGVERLVVLGLPLDRLGVRVEEELARVAAVALGRVVGPVHAEAVALAGLHVGHVAVPHETVDLGQVDAGLDEVVVDEAELDALGDLGEDGEVHTRSVVGGSEGVGLAGPDLHGPSSVVGRGTGPRRHGVATGGRQWPQGAILRARRPRANRRGMPGGAGALPQLARPCFQYPMKATWERGIPPSPTRRRRQALTVSESPATQA